MALKTNKTPFTDILSLKKLPDKRDAAGYLITTDPTENREVFCSYVNGASRTEFYEAARAGLKISATVEIWEEDYDNEQLVSILNTDYKVVRVWPSGTGTLLLYLEETLT